MSLVLEALRRVEKPAATPGSIGVAVASFRPNQRRSRAVPPLLLGALCGVALLWSFTPAVPPPDPNGPGPSSQPAEVAGPVSRPGDSVLAHRANQARRSQLMKNLRALAAMPLPAESPPRVAGAVEEPAVPGTPAPAPLKVAASFVLQAISERDSHPIAIINEQLVKEGDLIGPVRVLKIGPDFVEVALPAGRSQIIRFAPPAPPEASSSPTPDPR